MYASPDDTLAALERVGYFTDQKTATTVYLSGKLLRPILLEGLPGPATAGQYRVRDRFSITENLSGGIQYLADLMTEFRGEIRLAVAAYYCGSERIARKGLRYRNSDVVSYVESVRSRYEIELHERANRDIPMPGKGQ